MTNFAIQPQSGWGRFPLGEGPLFRPERRSDVANILASGLFPSYIPRGLGRSYGDTALNGQGGVIDQTRLNRMLAFDPATGALTCEAGVSFAEIIETFLPRGWFLPVTPGTKFVTVGGAIANDVHGKNHHIDGAFSRFVEELTLLTPTGEVLTCSPTEHADVFWATVGGVGLTGTILTARFRLTRVSTAYAHVTYRQAKNLDEALALFAEDGDRHRLSVAWIDCLARGASMGRSVLMLGDYATPEQLGAGTAPLALAPAKKLAIPMDFPSGTLNRYSVAAFNALFYAKHGNRDQVVHFEPYFYPLDAIRDWNRMYGKAGFVQYQVALPESTAREGLTELLERFSGSGRASFLAVLKRFGPEGSGLLSFPMAGYTLALDLPMDATLPAFLRELDARVVAWGGRLYLAKDALVSREHFERMYPRLAEFKAIQRRLDPQGRMGSTQARRLGLVEG
ncbi:putative decaprenylphosphoryl-beta-D-ribose oxidase [compost metagenome]